MGYVIFNGHEKVNCPECNPVFNVSGPAAPDSQGLIFHCSAMSASMEYEQLMIVVSDVNYAEILSQIPMAEIVKYMNETE